MYSDLSKVLVIIDVQDGFYIDEGEQDWNTMVNNIVEQIRQARSENTPILVVEYDGEVYYGESFGFTDHQIMDALDGYQHFRIIEKSEDDGSCEVHDALSYYFGSNDRRDIELVFCGVNLGACVEATMSGLYDMGYENLSLLVRCANQPAHWGTWINKLYSLERYLQCNLIHN